MVKFKNIKKTKETKLKKSKPKEVKTEKVAPKKEKNNKKKEFPNILRIIPERRFWLCVISILSILVMILIGIGIGKSIVLARELQQQRVSVEKHILFLQDLAKRYPGNRDIFLQMALGSYALGDMKQAEIYTEQSLLIDPNYLPALKLKGFIITNK